MLFWYVWNLVCIVPHHRIHTVGELSPGSNTVIYLYTLTYLILRDIVVWGGGGAERE